VKRNKPHANLACTAVGAVQLNRYLIEWYLRHVS